MIPCKLVHDTGTMIRFRRRQLAQLPNASGDVGLLLPNGAVVPGHFNRHRQNPNVSGAELVRYIKGRIGFGEREEVLVEIASASPWIVHTVRDALVVAQEARVPIGHVRSGALKVGDLAALTALADRENNRERRIRNYRRVLRPSGLRRLVLDLLGAKCMVRDCSACSMLNAHWGSGSGELIVEVHHIEHVARSNDHHPRNLCVLCANHHRFIHNSGAWTVQHDGATVVFGRGSRELVVERSASVFGDA